MMFHYTIYKVNVLWLQNSIIENFDIVKMHYTRSNIIISMFMSFCNTDEEGGGGGSSPCSKFLQRLPFNYTFHS